MTPSIARGGLAFEQPVDPASIRVGDVVTVRQNDQAAYTHRVVEVVESADGRQIQTRGDANPTPDPALVPATAVVGRVLFWVPIAGYLLALLGLPMGMASVALMIGSLAIEVWVLGDLAGDWSDPDADAEADRDAQTAGRLKLADGPARLPCLARRNAAARPAVQLATSVVGAAVMRAVQRPFAVDRSSGPRDDGHADARDARPRGLEGRERPPNARAAPRDRPPWSPCSGSLPSPVRVRSSTIRAPQNAAVGAGRIFPGTHSTSAFVVSDTSGGGGAVDRSSPFAAAADGLTQSTGSWSTAFSASRYVQFDLNSPLPDGLGASATFNLRFASSFARATLCVYLDVRRTSTGSVLGTYGSSGSPLACASGTSMATLRSRSAWSARVTPPTT